MYLNKTYLVKFLFLTHPTSSPPPPPLTLVGPVLRHLERHHISSTMVVLDLYPRKYWWPLIQKYSTKSCRLAHRGDHNALETISIRLDSSSWTPLRPVGFRS